MKTMNKTQQHTTMKKRLMTLAFALLMAATPTMAQVFMMEDDDSFNRVEGEGIVFNVIVTPQDSNTDQFVPVGHGIMLLSALGSAYLLGKRRRKEETNNHINQNQM